MDSTPGLGPIRWQDYTHEQMWQMLMHADAAAMFDEAEKLNTLARELGAATDDAHGIAQSVLGAWDGGAAQNAATLITKFMKWADETANTAGSIAGLLSQYAHVVNRAKLTIPEPIEAGQPATQGGPMVTTAQANAGKTTAVHVMEHYASQSRDIFAQLHTHQFTAPPKGTGLPLPPPALEPVQPPYPAPKRPTTPPRGSTTISANASPPAADLSTTMPSDFTGTAGGAGVVGGAGAGGLSGGDGMGGLAGVGVLGGVPASGAVSMGRPGMSAVGAMTDEAAAAEELAAAEKQAGWNGFAPIPPGGRRGAEDGEHRNRYDHRTDLVGELPPAYPPVLGL